MIRRQDAAPAALPLRVTAEISAAQAAGRPVVALETTLVSHGFPGGAGLDVALESEARVRSAGSVPATIAVLDGEIRIGLSEAELARIAAAGPAARKVSARDLAACAVQGAIGSTTVGGTLAVCRLAGIRFLATGGIGGVHRGFAQSLDISADLGQIAATQAVVVCSGAKAILDVSATAELLETLAVPVLGWRTATMPLFYTAAGGPPVSAEVATAAEAAKIAAAHWQLAGAAGILLARPPEAGLDLGAVVSEAVDRVRAAGITGQAVTPAALQLVSELSGGRSVDVNRELIAGNAALAGEVAAAYAAAGPGW